MSSRNFHAGVGGSTPFSGNVLGCLNPLVLVDVARAIIVDFCHLDAHDELCAWIRRHQVILLLDAGDNLE